MFACMPPVVLAEDMEEYDMDMEEDSAEAAAVAAAAEQAAAQAAEQAAFQAAEAEAEAATVAADIMLAKEEAMAAAAAAAADSKSMISNVKGQIASLMSKVTKPGKGLVDKIKSVEKKDAKKVAAGLLGAWGVSLGAGWVKRNGAAGDVANKGRK